MIYLMCLYPLLYPRVPVPDRVNDVQLKTMKQKECLLTRLRNYAIVQKNPDLCGLALTVDSIQGEACNFFIKDFKDVGNVQGFPKQINRNTLLMASNERGGRFLDKTSEMGVDKSYWSWNAKAADLDNDGWQDIYVATGFIDSGIHTNVFFHNKKGRYFERQEEAYGLQDYLYTTSYVYTDLDNDGDLDIVANGINAPVRLFINNEANNHSISIQLFDKKNDLHAVGSKVYIYYGNNGQQMREVKLGGGFLSFNSTRLHFGLGKLKKIKHIKIRWNDGYVTNIKKELLTNHHYEITRL